MHTALSAPNHRAAEVNATSLQADRGTDKPYLTTLVHTPLALSLSFAWPRFANNSR